MTEIYLLICIALLQVLTLIAILSDGRRLMKPAARETEKAETPSEEKRAQDPMDEGFRNIMQYSVKGKTGFPDETFDE